ncbi:MAG TPA: peptidase M23, partial [Flavobacteriia bacterium]|nr:peptidase M23 [Flavobacteriia bacterium]
VYAQNKKQLQTKRAKLQREIKEINKLLSKNKKTKQNILSNLGDINKKIEVRQEILDTYTQEAKAFAKEINTNKKEIDSLEIQLDALKKEYAKIVEQTYKNKNKHSDLIFILSSNSFTQAYKRALYMKQYTDYRKNQAKKIKEDKLYLKTLNDTLQAKKQEKDALIAKKLEETKSIDKALAKQKDLLKKIKKKEKKYIAQIRKKEKQERQFEKELNSLIKGAIAKSSKKTTKKGSKKVAIKLTPEASKLAAGFVANKGKLPHPVEKGYVSRYFGQRKHEQLKKIMVKSNGWHYITDKGSNARAVFKGNVFAVMVDKKTKLKTILLQHGNYFTAYRNLDKIFVKKGDKVNIKQNLGTIHTDKTTGKTKLVFALLKNTTPQNPSSWLKK